MSSLATLAVALAFAIALLLRGGLGRMLCYVIEFKETVVLLI